MPAPFDPYHRWLGIPPEKQPPNHYALLAIEPLEDNPDVIESAADQRMAHLRTFQTGKHSDLSQKLLNEVAAAKLCLLSPQKKAAYDEALRRKSAAQRPETEKDQARAVPVADPGLAGLFVKTGQGTSAVRPRGAGMTQSAKLAASVGVLVAGVLLVVGLLLWGPGSGPDPDQPGQGPAASAPGPGQPDPNDPGQGTVASPAEPAQPDPNDPGQGTAASAAGPGQPDQNDPGQGTAASAAGPHQPDPSDPGQGTAASAAGPDQPDQPDPDQINSQSEPPVDPEPVEQQRRPVPTAEAQDKVLSQLKEVYNFAAAKTSAAQLDLAGRLFDLGKQARDNPAEQFVLLRKAMELAGDGGDAALMLEAVEAIGADFEVDVLEVKQKVLLKFAKTATDAQKIGSLVENALPLVDRALADGRREAAFQLVDATYGACTTSAGKDFRKEVYDRRL